jgi:hypothetical protein
LIGNYLRDIRRCFDGNSAVTFVKAALRTCMLQWRGHCSFRFEHLVAQTLTIHAKKRNYARATTAPIAFCRAPLLQQSPAPRAAAESERRRTRGVGGDDRLHTAKEEGGGQEWGMTKLRTGFKSDWSNLGVWVMTCS